MRKYIMLRGHCRGLDLSMFYLKHSELLLQERCDLRRGPCRGGAKLFLGNSCSSWGSLENGWLCVNEPNSTRNLVYARGMHQVYYKVKQVGNTQPQLQIIPPPPVRTKAGPKAAKHSLFSSLHCLGRAQLFFLLHTPYWGVLWDRGACESVLWLVSQHLSSSFCGSWELIEVYCIKCRAC